jgi:twitching motility two-component system response regulator PilH
LPLATEIGTPGATSHAQKSEPAVNPAQGAQTPRCETLCAHEKERLMAKETILVVDDSPTDLRVVTSLLQSKGYMVITAGDGEEALEKASRERPRLMVLDVILPKKNGFQVCRQLKTSPDTKEIKIVMLTAKVQDSDRFWGLKQGADDYINKPFEDEELLKSVDQLI